MTSKLLAVLLVTVSQSCSALMIVASSAPVRHHNANVPRRAVAACTVDPDDSVSEEDVAAWLQAGAAEAAEAAESGEPALKVPRDLEAIGRLVRGEGKKKPSMLELIFSPAAGQPEPGPKETGFGSLFARRKRATEGAGEEGS